MTSKAWSTAFLMFGTALTTNANAQSGAGGTSSQAPAVDEIIVTAQRRSEELQKVPVSVTAITPAKLEQLNLRDIQNLATVTPGVTFDTGLGFAQVFIRGIGANFPAPGLESPVATYVDGSYVERADGTLFSLLDVGSIQVLKGPQGTLYGRNATGGVILLNTADPVNSFEGYALGEYGRFNHGLVEGVINVPLTDNLAVRVAGRYVTDDGYVDNLTTGTKAGGGKTYIVRGKAKWSPDNDFSATLGFEISRQKMLDPNFSTQILAAPLCLACQLGGQFATGRNEVRNDITGFQRNNSTSVNLHLKKTSGIISIDSVTAYRNLNFSYSTIDLDGTDFPLFEYANDAGSKTYTQDLTVSTDSHDWYDVLFGISYLHEDAYGKPYPRGAALQELKDGTGEFPSSFVTIGTTSVAAFAEATLRPVPRFSVILGGRYNYDRRSLVGDSNLAGILAFGGGTSPAHWEQSVSFRSFTPRVVLSYDAGVANLYASFNKGFRAGGFNTPTFAPQDPVRPEKIESYEAGVKYVSPDRKLRLSLSGYYYKQTDLQVGITDVESGGSVIQNAASADAYGGEVEGSYAFSRQFSVYAGGSYIRARYKSYPDASVVTLVRDEDGNPAGITQGVADLSRQRTPRSPTFSAFIGFDNKFALSDSFELGVSGVLRYTDGYDFFPGAGGDLGLDKQPSTVIINGSAYVGPSDGRYQIGVYVNNLTDQLYYQNRSTTAPFGAYQTVAMPRSFGARLKYVF